MSVTRLRLFLPVLVLLLLSACSGSAIKRTPPSTTVYDRVMKSGILRCGYAIYNPGCMKDPNSGKLYGIGVDTLEAVAKNLGLKVEWTEEVGWGTMIEGLQSNRYDIVATPVWATADRAKVIDFSAPLYYSPVCAYVSTKGKKKISADLHDLNSPTVTIATIDGATAEIIAREDYPQVKRFSLPQMTDFGQLLLTVSSGKADITFTEPADAVNFMKNNPGAVVPIGSPVRVFPNCWIFRRGQEEFKDMINTALAQLINSGTVEKVIHKYEPAPNTIYRVANPYSNRAPTQEQPRL